MSDTTETETDTNTNTDEPTKAELHDRVRKLESTVEKLMPSRRDALRMGAAGIAGAAGLGAATQSVEASTGSAGTIGSSGSRPDLLADEIDANSIKNGSNIVAQSGGFLATGPTFAAVSEGFTRSTSGFVEDTNMGPMRTIIDVWLPSNAQLKIYSIVGKGGPGDGTVRLRNITDGETIWSVAVSRAQNIQRVDAYNPSTTNSVINLKIQAESTNGKAVALFGECINLGLET